MTPNLLVPLVAATLALSGCTGSTGDQASVSPASAGASDGGGSGGESVAEPAAPGDAAPLARVAPAGSVIRTAELEVVVDDVRAAADEAARLVTTGGGTLEAEDRSDDGELAVAVLRLRVPPADLDATITRLSGLGTERTRRLGSEDVTEQVLDLDSRLATQRASVERVRALLAEATTLGEVVQVEAELTSRTADLESLTTRLAALTSRVDLATLTLRLAADGSALTASDEPAGFRDGLREGWAAVVAIGRGLGVAAGALLPFSPLLLLGGWLLLRSRRATAA